MNWYARSWAGVARLGRLALYLSLSSLTEGKMTFIVGINPILCFLPCDPDNSTQTFLGTVGPTLSLYLMCDLGQVTAFRGLFPSC